jgi:hypothetical protein
MTPEPHTPDPGREARQSPPQRLMHPANGRAGTAFQPGSHLYRKNLSRKIIEKNRVKSL